MHDSNKTEPSGLAEPVGQAVQTFDPIESSNESAGQMVGCADPKMQNEPAIIKKVSFRITCSEQGFYTHMIRTFGAFDNGVVSRAIGPCQAQMT
jgi:hypothetical protein